MQKWIRVDGIEVDCFAVRVGSSFFLTNTSVRKNQLMADQGRESETDKPKTDLIIVTFVRILSGIIFQCYLILRACMQQDQRNHGSRLVSHLSNLAWDLKNSSNHNERHGWVCFRPLERRHGLMDRFQDRYVFHTRSVAFHISAIGLMGNRITQVGTSRDVSFLIDVLPAYLYPNDERTIVNWVTAGISLGGHATWLVLRNGISFESS